MLSNLTVNVARMLEVPSSSFLLLGARGTGKSTWLREHFARAHVFDLLDERLFQSLLRDPGEFAGALRALPPDSWVVVDEIQRLPLLLNEVHRFIESSSLRFALSGSSARKLKRAGTNLLAGRLLSRTMHPFVPEELGSAFELGKVLKYGAIPLVWSHAEPMEALRSYAELYLKEEIQAEALVRNLSGFSRFLPVAALFHGQVLNVSSLARDAGVSRSTLQGYLTVLEDTLLAFQVPAFDGPLRVRQRKHPKLYLIDPGLARALRGMLAVSAPELTGPLLEGFVASMLRAYRDTRRAFESMYYWSPSGSRVEVDFLVGQGNAWAAIEVKATDRIRNEHFRGLRAVEGLDGLRKRYLVYMGERAQQTEDGIDVLPVVEFSRCLEESRLFG